MMQSSIHFPPFRQGRSVRQTEAVGTGGGPASACILAQLTRRLPATPAPGAVPAPTQLPRALREPMGAARLTAGWGSPLMGSPGT